MLLAKVRLQVGRVNLLSGSGFAARIFFPGENS
jgi:hypothetical protein